MNCAYCEKYFSDGELELSHDIPRYLGGIDKDGRHYLCKDHHNYYKLKIVNACLEYVGEEPAKSRDEVLFWCKELKKQPELLKTRFRAIAQEVKEEFYGNI